MSKTKDITTIAIFSAIALALSIFERFIPIQIIPLQGFKIGLANIVIVLILYLKGFKQAFFINIMRVMILAIIFSGVSGFLYSFSGAVISVFAMGIAKKTDLFGFVGVSIIGAITHNISQVTMAGIIINDFRIFYYLPLLLMSGLVFGFVIGVFSFNVTSRIKEINY